MCVFAPYLHKRTVEVKLKIIILLTLAEVLKSQTISLSNPPTDHGSKLRNIVSGSVLPDRSQTVTNSQLCSFKSTLIQPPTTSSSYPFRLMFNF